MSRRLGIRVAALSAGILLLQATVWGEVRAQEAQPEARRGTVSVPGLERSVEILRDRWGINHIYAETEHDLFFAQGYSAVRDRLFQFELWRRQATGTVSEILGPRELRRDVGTRLFKFRGDLDQELSHYHPNGVEIVNAFVDGINAYVEEVLANPDLLTVEFELLGIAPGSNTRRLFTTSGPTTATARP